MKALKILIIAGLVYTMLALAKAALLWLFWLNPVVVGLLSAVAVFGAIIWVLAKVVDNA